MTSPCPACDATDALDVLECSGVPVNSCLLVEDSSTALGFSRGDLDIAVCRRCGFGWNRRFSPGSSEYSAAYEETQACSATFREFIADLAHGWVSRYGLTGRHVVEIGCGKGEFLVEMVRAGAASGLGVDPGVDTARIPDDVGVRTQWVAGFFPEDHRDLSTADAVVCRHTLEHVPDVHRFLTDVRSALGDRDVPLLFELPDTRRVLTDGAFEDVYYEHCSYFTAGSLARLFRRCGFDVLDVSRVYGDQYLLLEARPTNAASPARPPSALEDDLAETVELAATFSSTWSDVVSRWRDEISGVEASGGRTVLWGGGSKAVAFLSALGPDARSVAAAVDINPRKHGRYIAGTGHRVVAPKELVDLQPTLVVAMNSAYTGEIGAELADLGVSARLVGL